MARSGLSSTIIKLVSELGFDSCRGLFRMAGENDPRWPECFGTDLEFVNIRDVHRTPRKGEPYDAVGTVVARNIEVRCRECGCTDFILK
jgi:hypothetical protein